MKSTEIIVTVTGESQASKMMVIDHCSADFVGIHAVKRAPIESLSHGWIIELLEYRSRPGTGRADFSILRWSHSHQRVSR